MIRTWAASLCVCLFLAVLACGCGGGATASRPDLPEFPSNAHIDQVTDGDTVTVVTDGGRKEKVRLIGVDTPETVDPNRPDGCYGKEASSFTKASLPGDTPVHLVLDAEPRDRFGRLLAYVYRSSDGMFVNAELARQGYAEPLTIAPNVTHTDQFTALTAEARQNRRGMWGVCPA